MIMGIADGDDFQLVGHLRAEKKKQNRGFSKGEVVGGVQTKCP